MRIQYIQTFNIIYYRPQQRGRSTVIEGVYNNIHFMHAVASQIGNVVQIQTKSGAIFEGIFYTVSPHFEIVLQLVHRIEIPSTNTTLSSSTSSNTSSNNGLAGCGITGILLLNPKIHITQCNNFQSKSRRKCSEY